MTKRKLLQATAPAPHPAKFLIEALAIDVEEAKKNGTLGYMARALALAMLQHSKTEISEFTRTNTIRVKRNVLIR